MDSQFRVAGEASQSWQKASRSKSHLTWMTAGKERACAEKLPSFLSQSLTLLLRMECSGAISAHYKLHLLGLSDSSAAASQVAGIPGTHHHALLIFVVLVEMGFY